MVKVGSRKRCAVLVSTTIVILVMWIQWKLLLSDGNAPQEQDLSLPVPLSTYAQPTAPAISESSGPPSALCPVENLIQFPLSGLEQELERLGKITAAVMRAVNATYWPTDGTLLGLMRNGRVSTDRDLDYQIHSTYDQCASLLGSLKTRFERLARIKSFKVVKVKYNGRKIGRYAMVRLFREYGTFDTGPDFNCVYMDEPSSPRFYTHRGVLALVPHTVYPLGWCLMYGKPVPCPRDGMAVLSSLKPRYDGCMVFPHCLGDPNHSSRRCLSPHPPFPLHRFEESTIALGKCGFTSLREHLRLEPSCKALAAATPKCETVEGNEVCFLQKFDG